MKAKIGFDKKGGSYVGDTIIGSPMGRSWEG